MITRAPMATGFSLGTCTNPNCSGIHIVPVNEKDEPIAEMVLSEQQAMWLVQQICELLGCEVKFEAPSKH